MTEQEIYHTPEEEVEVPQVPKEIEVSKNEYMARITENELHWRNIYDQAVSGLLECQRARLALEQISGQQVIKFIKHCETDEISIKISPKGKMGLLPWKSVDDIEP